MLLVQADVIHVRVHLSLYTVVCYGTLVRTDTIHNPLLSHPPAVECPAPLTSNVDSHISGQSARPRHLRGHSIS